MAEAVAGLLASAFVNIAKDKLSSAIAEQANFLWNFGDDLEDMKDLLETISAALEDAERRSGKEKLVQLCLKRLKDVAQDISDVLEDYQDDQKTSKKPGVLSCLPTACKKISMANRMNSVREKLSKISKEFEKFKFIITQDTNPTIVQNYDKRETASHFLPEVKGRDGEKKEIINLLLHACTNNDDSETVIVPIYALGGMGKSTLAQLVYNDENFKKYDHRVWVYVSQEYNLLKIGTSIILQLIKTEGQQNQDYQNRGLQVIKQSLNDLLRGKKVLIVLDDLWEKGHTELWKLKNMLLVGRKGSMIDVIVTTREEGIAREVSTNEPYKLQPLQDDTCWEIIKRYSNYEGKSNKNELEQIGLDLAKKCGGLPLAAQTLGCMLQSRDLSEWKKINNSYIWNESSEDSVLPSLKLSYQRMPQQLRICFSYCAIFSKGHNIVEDDLIYQWSGLDFIEPSKGKEYIKQLLGMSFLQISKLRLTSQNHVVQYTMHDLVHDLARLTMADELIVSNNAHDRNTRGQKYCRYSLLRQYDRTTKLADILPSKMRALHFSDSGILDIPNAAFSFVKYLRTLDFSECSGIFLPASIGQPKQLRCLIAPRIQNDSLPECITELSKLQYLNINGSSKITELPRSIGKLGCLKYLCLSGCSGISKLAESFGDLKYMVHLDMSGCFWLTELPDSLGNLRHLQHLNLSGCSNVKALPQSLCGLTQLQYLNLSSCDCLEELPEGIGSLVGIQHLNMSSCEHIRELPESLMKLQSLSHLNLSDCYRMRRGSLACLRGLTALQHLDISYFVYSHRHNDFLDDFIATLANLEHLDLSSNFELAYLPESIGNLTRLHTLDLSYCSKLKSLPESIGALGLKSLVLEGCSDELMDKASSLVNYSQTLPLFKVRADEVNGCSNLHELEHVHASDLRICCLENVRCLEEASKVKLSDRHNLSELTLAWSTKREVQILEDKDLLEQLVPPTGLKSFCLQGYNCTSFPGWLMGISRHLTGLVSIQLRDLPTCSNLPPLGQLPHLENLVLRNMSSIKIINKEFCGGKGAFRRLASFEVSSMEGLEEWNTTYSVEDGVEEFMFPVLDNLEIQFCPRLRLKPCPPAFRGCGIRWSDQVISSLEEVDNTSYHCFSSSRAIQLFLVISTESCQSIRLFHHFPALRKLYIGGRQLRSVPESIRHLTSLESLTLSWCEAISELPEWLGDLSSLRRLVITRCAGIKSLPPCIQQLNKLQQLQIDNSQELTDWL